RNKHPQIIDLKTMEAIERLTAGMAHDFNNLVAGMIGCVEALETEIPPENPAFVEAEEIRTTCERAGAMTRQLMAFSRKQVATPTAVSRSHALTDMQKMLSRAVPSNVKLDLRLGEDLPPAHIDVGQLQQILLNLVLNARDAMPQGGQVTIRTGQVTLD